MAIILVRLHIEGNLTLNHIFIMQIFENRIIRLTVISLNGYLSKKNIITKNLMSAKAMCNEFLINHVT